MFLELKLFRNKTKFAADKTQNKRDAERKRERRTQNLSWFPSQIESTPVPLLLTRDFHYNLLKITNCSSTLARDFSGAQVSLNKRLLKCSS